MKHKIMAIINPVSSNGKTAKLWPEYERYFQQHGIELETRFTQYPGHAIELAQSAVTEGYRKIMAVGGDGTINEIVNGLFDGEELVDEDISLIVFSQGTGCDFIRTLGISKQINDIVDIIKRDQNSLLDIGQVEYLNHSGIKKKRLFVNLADTGIGASTAKIVNESSKLLGGFLTYLIGVLRTLIFYRNKKIRVIIDGEEEYNQYLNSVMIANGKFFGGGIEIAPEADLFSGCFNIVVLRNLSKLDIVINLTNAYKGTHLSHPLVDSIQGQEIVLAYSGQEDSELELDGESVGVLPARFRVLKAKLPVMV